jgi:hypothetical protein
MVMIAALTSSTMSNFNAHRLLPAEEEHGLQHHSQPQPEPDDIRLQRLGQYHGRSGTALWLLRSLLTYSTVIQRTKSRISVVAILQ